MYRKTRQHCRTYAQLEKSLEMHKMQDLSYTSQNFSATNQKDTLSFVSHLHQIRHLSGDRNEWHICFRLRYTTRPKHLSIIHIQYVRICQTVDTKLETHNCHCMLEQYDFPSQSMVH